MAYGLKASSCDPLTITVIFQVAIHVCRYQAGREEIKAYAFWVFSSLLSVFTLNIQRKIWPTNTKYFLFDAPVWT